MTSRAAGAKGATRTKLFAKPVSAADRIHTPPFKPTGGITRAQIRKVIREVAAKRGSKQQG